MLGLMPLLASGIINAGNVVIESKSGITSLRSTDKLQNVEAVNEGDRKVYKLNNSSYSAEIKQHLEVLFGKSANISYTSYINGIRGIITKIIADPAIPLKDGEAAELYEQFYCCSPFIKVHSAGTSYTGNGIGSGGFCEITAEIDGNTGKLVVTTAMESIVKGMTEQAVQAMNLEYGFE